MSILRDGVAFGACRLPNDAGLIFKVLGPRNRAGEGQGARVLGRGAPGGHRRRHSLRPFSGASGSTVPAGDLEPASRHVRGGDNGEDCWQSGNACAASSGILRFVDINLRGIGQVMFQNNPLTGLLFLAAIAWGSYAAGVPQVAIAGAARGRRGDLDGAMAARRRSESLACRALWLQRPISSDLRWRHSWPRTPLLWVYVVLGAPFRSSRCSEPPTSFKTWGVSALTFPFVLTTWLLLLATLCDFPGSTAAALPSGGVVTAYQPGRGEPTSS